MLQIHIFCLIGICVQMCIKSELTIQNLEDYVLLGYNNCSRTPASRNGAWNARDRLCGVLCSAKKGCWFSNMSNDLCPRCFSRYDMADFRQRSGIHNINGPCPAHDWILVSSLKFCFKLSDQFDKLPWNGSQRECHRTGAHLIILNTEEKHNHVLRYIDTDSNEMLAWVGMTQVDGKFKWTDGTKYVRRWDEGEPDFVTHQKCVKLDFYKEGQSGLSDMECSNEYRYMCEIAI